MANHEHDLRKEILALRSANVALLDRAEAAESWGTPDYHRICLNCGRKIGRDIKHAAKIEGCKSPEACSYDMTYMELVARCQELEKLVIDVKRANQVLQELYEQQESNTKR